MIKHDAPISGVGALKGRFVATAGYDNKVILWDPVSHKALGRGCHDHLANQCRFSPCGRYLASSGSDYTLRLWHVPSMRLASVMMDHRDDVEAVAFHPSKPLVATACRDNLVRIFSFDGKVLARMEGHEADVISVEWIGTGDQVISSSDDGTVKRWDATSGNLLANLDLGGIETDTVVITREGYIIAGNDEGELIVIKSDGRQKIKAHKAGIKRLVYNEDGRALVSLSYDRTGKVWQVSSEGTLTMSRRMELPSVVWPRSCAFFDDDKLAFATFGTSYAVYDLSQDTWIDQHVEPTHGVNAVLEAKGHVYTVGDAGHVRRDGKLVCELPSLCNFLCEVGGFIITGGQSGAVFNAETGDILYQHHSPLNFANSYVFEDLERAAVATYTGEVVILTRRASKLCPEKVVKLHDNAIKGLAVDGSTLFSVCATGAAAFHDLGTMALRAHHADAHDKIANGCTCLGEARFASVSRDLKLRLWKEDRVEEVVETPFVHSIKCVASSSCGHFVAAGSYGGRIGIYHVPSGTWVSVERPTASGISYLSPTLDGQGFWASSYDGHFYFIPVTSMSERNARYG